MTDHILHIAKQHWTLMALIFLLAGCGASPTVTKTYYSDGKVKTVRKGNTLSVYSKSGSLLSVAQYDDDGRLHGIEKLYDNGTNVRTVQFHHGFRTGVLTIHGTPYAKYEKGVQTHTWEKGKWQRRDLTLNDQMTMLRWDRMMEAQAAKRRIAADEARSKARVNAARNRIAVNQLIQGIGQSVSRTTKPEYTDPKIKLTSRKAPQSSHYSPPSTTPSKPTSGVVETMRTRVWKGPRYQYEYITVKKSWNSRSGSYRTAGSAMRAAQKELNAIVAERKRGYSAFQNAELQKAYRDKKELDKKISEDLEKSLRKGE